MAETPIITYQDMVEHIWQSFNPSTKPPTGRELQQAKAAVITAYRELANAHEWNYYKRRTSVTTETSYSTGTITYDHTGGSNERELTLASGTWPANAAYGVVVIANKHYRVASRISDTVVTLDINNNPGADVAAGTSYVWYRDAYPFPVNFRKMISHPIEATSGGDQNPLRALEAGSHLYMTRYESGAVTNDPDWYTIINADNYMGALSFVLGRAPSAAKTYDMMYMVVPRPLRTYKEANGTISVSAGATSVTGSTTAFSEFHVGSIMRFTSSSSVEPTGFVGNVNGDDNPYIAQRTIMTVASTTALTIDSQISASTAISAAKHVISDPIDIEPHVMRTAMEMLCLFHYARLNKRESAPLYQQYAKQAILEAMEDDRRIDVIHVGSLNDFAGAIGWADTWGTVDVIP